MKSAILTSLSTVASKASSTILPIGVIAAGMVLSAPANAGTFSSCGVVEDNVTGTYDCTVSDDFSQDFLNSTPITVNQGDGFFDIDEWTFGGKIGVDTNFDGDGEGLSGEWDISSAIQTGWDDIMLVFKSGNGTNLTGYLVEDGVTSGNWLTPFTDPQKNVSHISVYYTEGGSASTPEPSLMIGLAFLGGGLVASRLRKSN